MHSGNGIEWDGAETASIFVEFETKEQAEKAIEQSEKFSYEGEAISVSSIAPLLLTVPLLLLLLLLLLFLVVVLEVAVSMLLLLWCRVNSKKKIL